MGCRWCLVAMAIMFGGLAAGDARAGVALREAASYPVRGVYGLVVADLDGDGRPDVVTANGDCLITVRLGRPRGRLGPARTTPVAECGRLVAVGRFTRPRLFDALLVNESDESAVLVPGLPRGRFASREWVAPLGSEQRASVADFNGDGLSDLVSTFEGKASSSFLDVAFGRHSGRLRQGFTLNRSQTGIYFGGTVARDLNQDGRPDLAYRVATDFGAGTAHVVVRPGLGDGRFGQPQVLPLGSIGTGELASGDLNGDGRRDLVTTGQDGSDGRVYALLGGRRGRYRVPHAVSLGRTASQSGPSYPTSPLVTADLTGDCRSDVIVPVAAGGPANTTNASLDIFVARASGALEPPSVLPVSGEADPSLATADFNRDGRADLLLASNGRLHVLLNRAARICRRHRR